MSAIRKFDKETMDERTLIVKSVGGQAVNLVARLDTGSLKDGSVDALTSARLFSSRLATPGCLDFM